MARKLAVLLEPLDGVPLSDYERRVLSWVACWETHTVAVIAALLRRARAHGTATKTATSSTENDQN